MADRQNRWSVHLRSGFCTALLVYYNMPWAWPSTLHPARPRSVPGAWTAQSFCIIKPTQARHLPPPAFFPADIAVILLRVP